MTELLQGATMMGCLTVALFFLRFWRETGDRFFLMFALGFATFGVNRLLLVALDDDEAETAVYAARLVAFMLIAAAIVDKNRVRQPA
jgi:hypothetical protein